MNKKYDAIIIGAGVIGAAIAFELAKKGYKTLNVDRLPSAGYGSTSGSCAVIRFHYSTPDGVATAREGYYYWINWSEYLEAEDERGLVNYINTGCLVIKTELNQYLKNVMTSLEDLGIDYEELDIKGIEKKFRFWIPANISRSNCPMTLTLRNPPARLWTERYLFLSQAISPIPSCPPTISSERLKPRVASLCSMPKWSTFAGKTVGLPVLC